MRVRLSHVLINLSIWIIELLSICFIKFQYYSTFIISFIYLELFVDYTDSFFGDALLHLRKFDIIERTVVIQFVNLAVSQLHALNPSQSTAILHIGLQMAHRLKTTNPLLYSCFREPCFASR